MVCSGRRYSTEIIECQRCRCILDNGHDVCIAYEVSGTALHKKTEIVALYITTKEEKSLYELHGSRCDANVSVTFQKDKEKKIMDHVDEKTKINSKAKRVLTPHQHITRRPSRENRASTYISTRMEKVKITDEHLGKENSVLLKGNICGKCYFENAFYATLISSVVIISCIFLGLAVYFFRKRLRYLRKDSQKMLPRNTDANRILMEIPTEHDNEYATIAEANTQLSTISAIRPSSQLLGSHYTEPRLLDVRDGYSESSRSLQLTQEKNMNDNPKFQSRGTHLLKDLNNGYVEPITAMKATKDNARREDSGACGIHDLNDSNDVASKSKVLQSESTNEYFKLVESCRIQAVQNSEGDDIKRERYLSTEPNQEYFQLQALSKIGVKGLKDYNHEGRECSEPKIEQLKDQQYCEKVPHDLQLNLEQETKLWSTDDDFHLQATVLLSTDTHTPNEGSLLNKEKKVVHEPFESEASSEEKNDAPDDESRYFVLEKGSISKAAN